MIAVGVVTTESRRRLLARTLKSLDREVMVFCDLAVGLVPNHIASWNALFRHADTALLFQDDVVVSRGWYEVAELFNERIPGNITSFYTRDSSVVRPESVARGYCYISGSRFLWEQSVMMKRDFHERFLAWVSGSLKHCFKFFKWITVSQDKLTLFWRKDKDHLLH